MFAINFLKHKNPLLNQYNISCKKENFEAVIFPNLGASLQKLTINSVNIIDEIKSKTTHLKKYSNQFNSSILFPFPNRIANGKYIFNSKTFELEINDIENNNALHGLIFDAPFELKKSEISTNKALLTFNFTQTNRNKGFPFLYNFELTYVFTPKTVQLLFIITNNDNCSFPFGIGWHPYFCSEKLHESTFNFISKEQFDFNQNLIPTNTKETSIKFPFKIKNTFFDDCFVLNEPKIDFATNLYQFEMRFTGTPANRFIQIYTPKERESIAIEPMTCAPNSFNNLFGLQILDSKNTFNWEIALTFK
jgi:aldose 1-epimerase